MKISITKNDIINHLVGFMFILFAFSDIMQSLKIVALASFLSVVAFFLCFPIKDDYFKAAMTLIWILLIFSLINPLFTENGLGGSIVLLGNLLLTFIYFQTSKRKLTTWIIGAYAIPVLFISYKLFVLKVPANEIYEGISRNHAGFTLTFWSIFILFHIKITYSKIWIIIPIISLVISFFLVGRTSIIVNFLLLLIVLFYKYKNKGVFKLLAALVLFTWLVFILFQQYGGLMLMETNLSAGLDTPRWKLWTEYVKNINLKSFLFGVDVTKIPFIHLYGDNPHNSFLKFHSRVGVGSLVFLGLFVVSVFKYLKRKELYILGLLFVLTIRALFDSDILIGKFDFIFFIITFYWVKIHNKKDEPANLHHHCSL